MESGIIIVLLILSVTLVMLKLDFVRIDIVAIGCMLALGSLVGALPVRE